MGLGAETETVLELTVLRAQASLFGVADLGVALFFIDSLTCSFERRECCVDMMLQQSSNVRR